MTPTPPPNADVILDEIAEKAAISLRKLPIGALKAERFEIVKQALTTYAKRFVEPLREEKVSSCCGSGFSWKEENNPNDKWSPLRFTACRKCGIECEEVPVWKFISDLQTNLTAALDEITALKLGLKKAHDNMFSWFSGEYANHPDTKEISNLLYGFENSITQVVRDRSHALMEVKRIAKERDAAREVLKKWSRKENGCCRECSAGNQYVDSVTRINHTPDCSIGKALSTPPETGEKGEG